MRLRGSGACGVWHGLELLRTPVNAVFESVTRLSLEPTTAATGPGRGAAAALAAAERSTAVSNCLLKAFSTDEPWSTVTGLIREKWSRGGLITLACDHWTKSTDLHRMRKRP